VVWVATNIAPLLPIVPDLSPTARIDARRMIDRSFSLSPPKTEIKPGRGESGSTAARLIGVCFRCFSGHRLSRAYDRGQGAFADAIEPRAPRELHSAKVHGGSASFGDGYEERRDQLFRVNVSTSGVESARSLCACACGCTYRCKRTHAYTRARAYIGILVYREGSSNLGHRADEGNGERLTGRKRRGNARLFSPPPPVPLRFLFPLPDVDRRIRDGIIARAPPSRFSRSRCADESSSSAEKFAGTRDAWSACFGRVVRLAAGSYPSLSLSRARASFLPRSLRANRANIRSRLTFTDRQWIRAP